MNAEATGLNPIKAPKSFLFVWGGGLLCLNCDITVMIASSFHTYCLIKQA